MLEEHLRDRPPERRFKPMRDEDFNWPRPFANGSPWADELDKSLEDLFRSLCCSERKVPSPWDKFRQDWIEASNVAFAREARGFPESRDV